MHLRISHLKKPQTDLLSCEELDEETDAIRMYKSYLFNKKIPS